MTLDLNVGQSRTLTDAVIATLEAATSSVVELRDSNVIGDHKAPAPPAGSENPEYPYCAVYRAFNLLHGPELGMDASADQQATYQFTSVGKTRAQAEGMADLVRRALLERDDAGFVNAIEPADGQKVIRRELESAMGPTPVGTVWNVIERVRLDTTPG